MDDLLQAYSPYLDRLLLVTDDIRTRELLPAVMTEGGTNGPSFHMAALRGMYDNGLLVVRPLTALNSNNEIWRRFACKECAVGHALMAMHYFDSRHDFNEAQFLRLSDERRRLVIMEETENKGECPLILLPFHACIALRRDSERLKRDRDRVAEGVVVTLPGMLCVQFYKAVDTLLWPQLEPHTPINTL